MPETHIVTSHLLPCSKTRDADNFPEHPPLNPTSQLSKMPRAISLFLTLRKISCIFWWHYCCVSWYKIIGERAPWILVDFPSIIDEIYGSLMNSGCMILHAFSWMSDWVIMDVLIQSICSKYIPRYTMKEHKLFSLRRSNHSQIPWRIIAPQFWLDQPHRGN